MVWERTKLNAKNGQTRTNRKANHDTRPMLQQLGAPHIFKQKPRDAETDEQPTNDQPTTRSKSLITDGR